ncbi:UDP-N-acetylglucosamine transferase subunit alg13 [Sarcoptes scabiei]|nr:UDP-N-acetylglucosamine transferase subunit alg13 [Sarcoptes scabiei]
MCSIDRFKNILVTVGTTRFDQLISLLIDPKIVKILIEIGCRNLMIQYGNYFDPDALNLLKTLSEINVEIFDYVESLEPYIKQADLVIGHAGTSLEVLRMKKPLLIVINDSLMDNHQLELAEELAANGYAIATKIEDFDQTLKKFDQNILNPFPERNPLIFRDFLMNLTKSS